MTLTQRAIYATLFASLTVLIAIIVSVAVPALDVSAMNYDSTNNSAAIHNLAMPGMTEDRYTAQGLDIVTLITDTIIPAMLPHASGQGVCGIDITCDSNGKALP